MNIAGPDLLEVLYRRRAVRAFEPVEIPPTVRDRILDAACRAPSSFNMQPYRFYWIQSPERRQAVARLCLGQSAAASASVLVAAIADIGSLRSTAQSQERWMREMKRSEDEIRAYRLKAAIGRVIFMPGPFSLFGALKWLLLGLVHVFTLVGTPPVSRQDLFQWATKSASLACQNLMIAAEALGLNTCPMEGFDQGRLSKLLGLSPMNHKLLMVIAIGRKSDRHVDQSQWRRPLEETVTLL